MPNRRRRALQLLAVFLAMGALYPALRITGLVRPRAQWTPDPNGRTFACPFEAYRRGDRAATNPLVAWTTPGDVERDLSLRAPCFRDDDCTRVGVASGCCASETFAVLETRARELRDALARCRGHGAECAQKCAPPNEVAACRAGVCILEERPRQRPSPAKQLQGMPGY